MAEAEPPRMGHAEVMALIRASAQKGFAARPPAGEADAVFRPARLDAVRRIDPDASAMVEAVVATEDGGITVAAGEVMGPARAAAAQVTMEDMAQRLAEARAEGYAQGQADGREAGHAAGRAEGMVAGRAEAEATFGPAREAFLAAVARMEDGAGLADGLAGVLAEAVRKLAAERAGQMIEALPAAFAARVEALADRVAQGVRAVSVRLNPDDLEAIRPHLAGCEVLEGAALTADPRLARGDVEVRAEGIRLADLLEVRG